MALSSALLVAITTLQQGQAAAKLTDVPGPVTAFVNVAVIPLDRERVLAGQTVVVQGDRITALGPTKQIRVPANAVRIDGRGKFLMPGLADMHMHLGIGVSDSQQAAQRLLLLLASGVTTIRNLDYQDWSGGLNGETLLQLRDRVTAGEVWGPRIYTAGTWYADTSKSVASNVEAYKAKGYDLIKVHHDFGWGLVAMGPPDSAAALAKLDSLAEAARRVGMPIAGHPVGGLAFALQHRFASVEHLLGFPGGFPPITNISLADTAKIPAAVAAARQAGVAVTPTLELLEAGFTNFYSSSPDTLAIVGVTVLRRLVRALQEGGVELLLGTDAPLFAPGKGVHQELHALVRAGLTPYQALVTGTRNVASYFGTLDSTGTVDVGKRADLVLLDANPLTDIRHTEQISGVMTAGRWLPKAKIEHRLADYAAD